MATLIKYNLDGKEIGEVQISEDSLKESVNGQLVKDYIVALRNNARQWSACTKTRAEVKHTTKKPVRQKGTGGARHGNLVGPQYRGGGIVFGPKPKFDQHVRINKKERQAAIHFLISEKVREGHVKIIESTQIDAPKTKTLSTFMKNCGLNKKVLFLGQSNVSKVSIEGKEQSVNVSCTQHHNFTRSLRNIPNARFSLAKNISGYDVMCARDLVMTEEALNELKEWLCG